MKNLHNVFFTKDFKIIVSYEKNLNRYGIKNSIENYSYNQLKYINKDIISIEDFLKDNKNIKLYINEPKYGKNLFTIYLYKYIKNMKNIEIVTNSLYIYNRIKTYIPQLSKFNITIIFFNK